MSFRAFLLSLIIALPALAHGTSVSFRELNPKDEEHLKKSLPRLLSPDVDQSVLDEAIRILMSRGYYENIFVQRNANGNYELIGKPLRVVEEIKFNGLSEVSEAELRDLLDFKIGDRFDRKKAVLAAEKMKNYYGEHGFFNAVIELNFQKAESKNIRLVFDVQENQPCLIKRLDFETPNTDLKALLNSRFKWLKNKPLTSERMRRLMLDLEGLLIDHRYLATETLGPDAKYDGPKTEAYLQIEIRDPYRYEFYFDGNKFFSIADVYRALDLKNRERKNVDPAAEGAERLRRAYLEKGFPNAQIETKIFT
ncbi:MAG: POTRA domain-containing protein, partial [Bdellovibrionales bacterium]